MFGLIETNEVKNLVRNEWVTALQQLRAEDGIRFFFELELSTFGVFAYAVIDFIVLERDGVSFIYSKVIAVWSFVISLTCIQSANWKHSIVIRMWSKLSLYFLTCNLPTCQAWCWVE